MATTWKDPVKVATTKDLGSPPSIPGDGKIDGVALAAGDRVLVKDQARPQENENGIYEVQPGPPLALARPVGETVEPEDAVRVSEGNTNPHTEWALRAQGTIVVDTTKLPWVRRDPFFNVLDFGADPSGKTDSWQAFKDWSQAITAAGGGIGLVPAGTYLIEKFTAIYEPGSPDDFRFEGCEGLWLVGYGATLELRPKGDGPNGEVQVHLLPSGAIDRHMVCPFYIHDCHNVCLEGFEVNGHVDQVQFNGVIETGGHCVTVENSTHVTIRHMRLHHGWTDGISVRAAFTEPRLACRNVVIENCEIYSHIRASIAVFETRHFRISDCRIYNSGMGIDIEPDLRIGTEFDKDIEPPGSGSSPDRDPVDNKGKILAPPGSSRFTIIENCEIYNNEKPLSVNMRYSQVRVQGCFIDNQHNNQQPVVLSVPHCALLDCEIDAGTGRIDVALTGADPGYNVFTMERCLVRSNTAIVNGELTTGRGLIIAPDATVRPLRILQALVANNRFINESDQPWFPLDEHGLGVDTGARLPDLSHGDSMLQLTFRDNYVFIPKEAFSYRGKGNPMTVVGMHAHLAENNVYETDFKGVDVKDGENYFLVQYGLSGTLPKYGVLVRNERFISAGDGKGIRPSDNTLHDNTFPYSQGVQSVGTELPPGRTQRVFFATDEPSSGVFQQGDLIFKSDASTGKPMGWVCTTGGTARDPVNPAVFAPMPNL